MNKLFLNDVSILIPVRIESLSRFENLDIVTRYIRENFSTKIYIIESDKAPKVHTSVIEKTEYKFIIDENPFFWRTKINNLLINSCDTPYAILYDIDVIISPDQLIESINLLRSNICNFVLPYDGRFVMIDPINKKIFSESLNLSVFENYLNHYFIDSNLSVGGCFAFNREVYKDCGLENEEIRGWGHDDIERNKRIKKLGYSINRVNGSLFHLWHDRKENSRFFDEELAFESYKTYFETCSLSKKELEQKIQTWQWKH